MNDSEISHTTQTATEKLLVDSDETVSYQEEETQNAKNAKILFRRIGGMFLFATILAIVLRFFKF